MFTAISFSKSSLRWVLRRYVAHSPAEHNHQGLDNRLVTPAVVISLPRGTAKRRIRSGGKLDYYYQEAAYSAPVLFLDTRGIILGGQRVNHAWKRLYFYHIIIKLSIRANCTMV
jgi:hypothetical protein